VATIIGSPPNGIAVRYVQQTFGMNPYVLILACTLGASSAYMMPVGTPPNAIVFGTGLVRLPQMMKAGFWMNLAGILVITALATLFIARLLDGASGGRPGGKRVHEAEVRHRRCVPHHRHHLPGVRALADRRHEPQHALLAGLTPSAFVEIGTVLAEREGIKNGDRFIVSSARGSIEVYALVTERFQPFFVAGRLIHEIGLPWHWGYAGIATGDIANDLTASIGDANSQIPETRVFLCCIKRRDPA
jgi:hypothetical protein